MSTKNSSNKESGINWPKTAKRQAAEQNHMAQVAQETLNNAVSVSQLLTAAESIPQPHQKRLMREAVNAAMAIGQAEPVGRKPKGQRSWEKHADEYFAENQAWTEVEGIRLQCVDLLRTSLAVTPLLRSRELLSHVKNVRLLTRNIQAITRDTVTLSGVLGNVHKLHKENVGGAKSQEEMAQSCTVFSEYVDFMERYDAALMPIVVHTSEMLQEALWKLHETNPVLANDLNNQMQRILQSIQNIIHENTGADPIVSPNAVAELPQEPAPVAEAA